MRRLLFLAYLTLVHSDHNMQTNRSDIIITYEGHVEAFHPETTTTTTNTTIVKTTIQDTTTEAAKVEENTFEYPADEEAVIFIPNEKVVQRVEDEFYNAPMHIGDVLLNQKAVVDVMKAATEPPNKDILFITGKNAEKEDIKPRRQSDKHMDTRRSGSETESMKKKKLDCSNLICKNNLKSICGGKKENKQWRYRLFLNECYFRKVNCNFQYEENRYREVPKARCDNVGIHLQSRPSSTLPTPVPSKQNLNLRRSSSARRTLNLDMNGKFCEHPCPRFCLENYDPECAMSRSGVKRVFMNHCKLDFTSCYYGEVWQRRPLADCIGFKKADMRENRGFIGWMQRAGMVDKKGKLTL